MDLMEMLRGRRTYRRFDQSRPIPDEALRDMKEAFRLASSGGNQQPLRCVFTRKSETVDAVFAHTRWAALLPKELGTPKEGQRPVMFAALIYDRQKAPDTDAGLALSNLTLAAWAHGIGSCIMANIDREEIAAILSIPEPFKIHTVVAFGYPAHESHIVLPGADGSLAYRVDANGDYLVPKLPADTLCRDESWQAKE